MGIAQPINLLGKWRTKCGALANVTQINPGGYLGTVRIKKGEVHNVNRDMDFPCKWDKDGICTDYKDHEWDLKDRVRPEEPPNASI